MCLSSQAPQQPLLHVKGHFLNIKNKPNVNLPPPRHIIDWEGVWEARWNNMLGNVLGKRVENLGQVFRVFCLGWCNSRYVRNFGIYHIVVACALSSPRPPVKGKVTMTCNPLYLDDIRLISMFTTSIPNMKGYVGQFWVAPSMPHA